MGCLRWDCTGDDSAIENGRSFFVGCCGVKYVSLPACTDTALSASEQTTFQYLRGAEYHYSWTASRTVETLLTDVRAFYLYGRRMREREKQRASGHRRTHCASMSRGDAVPQERAAPLLVPVPHRRASRFAIASSKFRRELSRALLCRQLYLCFVTFSGSVQCSKLSFIVCCHDLVHWD